MSTAASTYDRKSIEEFISEQIAATGVDPGAISPAATFDSLGLDSLDVVELSQSVKKNLGVAVSPKDFVDAETIADAITVICQRAGIE